MGFIALNKYKIINYFDTLKSENLGFYFSFILHLLILLFAIGLPNFFDPKPIKIPKIIPIEILNVSEVTSIPKEIKEVKIAEIKKTKIKKKIFNSSNNQEIKKIDIKQKPKVKEEQYKDEIQSKEEVTVKEKKELSVNLEKKIVDIDTNNFETLPTKKIKPKLKPKQQNAIENKKLKDVKVDIKPKLNENKKLKDVKVDIKPKLKPKPDFSIATMLKDLRNEQSRESLDSIEDEKQEEKIEQPNENSLRENAQLSISEIDLLRQQLTSCWNAPAGAVIEKGMLVKISAKVQRNRKIYENSVRIVDTNISQSNSFYGPITESAMRTLLNPQCTPLKLPEAKYDLWKNLTITFDYSIMKGY